MVEGNGVMENRGRPRLPDSERQSEWIRLAVRRELYERVRMIAERENRSMSSVAREAIKNYLEGMK